MKVVKATCIAGMFFITSTVFATDVVNTRRMSMELANEIAMQAVKNCQKKGYQVSAVVVDRQGIVQVVLRDTLATRFSIEIAQRKANASIMSGQNSGVFRKNRGDIRPELNHIDGLIMMQGGVPIRAAGSLLGAVGVSGAPGGEKDDICAKQAIAHVQERLDFSE